MFNMFYTFSKHYLIVISHKHQTHFAAGARAKPNPLDSHLGSLNNRTHGLAIQAKLGLDVDPDS